MNSVTVLDCTFRDGGYYTNWEFDDRLVSNYMKAVERSGVDVVEIGYRSIRNNSWSGYLFYTPDNYIKDVVGETSVKLAVMIDAADVISEGVDYALSFFPDGHEQISIIRVAAHRHEVFDVIPFLLALKEKGYGTCLNLMGFQNYNEEQFQEIAETESVVVSVDVLYFADSFGSMSVADVKRSVALIKQYWSGKIGFHAHNNQGTALTNALIAMDNGVDWIDSTVTGMGRGAGNLATEELLIQLSRDDSKYDPIPMLPIIQEYFGPLKNKEGWGSSIAYGVAAINSVHPSYVQKLSKKDFSSKQLISCLNYLSEVNASKFNNSIMEDALNSIVDKSKLTLTDFHYENSKPVLIVGASDYKESYKKEIEDLIEKNDLYVISLNDQGIREDLVDLYVVLNQNKYKKSFELFTRNSHKVLCALQAVPTANFDGFTEKVSYSIGRFDYEGNIKIPDNDVFWLGLAVALRMNARKITLFGIEKPYKDESYNSLLNDALKGVECSAIGKTSFSIKSVSVVGLLQGLS